MKKYRKLKLIIAKFDFEKYIHLMQQKNPNWSQKQIRCVLYWQSQIKKILKKEIQKYHPDLVLSCGSGIGTYSMEAVGIDVMNSLKKLNFPIEIKPQHYVHLVCLIGFKAQNTLEIFKQ